jgi:Oligosaccharide biosynthesis protein Alg14 like
MHVLLRKKIRASSISSIIRMMLLCMCIVALLVTAVAFVIQFIACLPIRARKHGLHTESEDASVAENKARSAAKRRGHGPNSTFITAVVLGSGGHTSEMLQLLQVLRYSLENLKTPSNA